MFDKSVPYAFQILIDEYPLGINAKGKKGIFPSNYVRTIMCHFIR